MTGIPDAVVELTDEERAELATWAREGIYHCPCRMRCMCDDEDKVYLFDAVGSIIAARFAAASGPWAEQLDAAKAERDEQREIAEWNDWACKKNQELFRQAEAERDAALARNAELEDERDKATHHAIECEAKMDAACAELARYGEPLNEVYETDGIIIVRQNLHDLRAQNAALRAELDNLRDRVTALADEWEQAMGPRVCIDRAGTCDGCGGWKDELVASYPTPDSEPWLCQECDDDGRREIIELRAIVRGSDDEAGACTCGESVPTVTTPGPCYWAENAPGIQSQVHCPPPDGVAR